MIAKNNPFNIRYSESNKWLGQVGCVRGFVVFDTYEHGIRAGLKLLVNYVRSGLSTVEDIITRYAPPSENDTDSYIRFVLKSPNVQKYCLNVSVTTYYDVCVLAHSILQYENSINEDLDFLTFVIKRYIHPHDKSVFSPI